MNYIVYAFDECEEEDVYNHFQDKNAALNFADKLFGACVPWTQVKRFSRIKVYQEIRE